MGLSRSIVGANRPTLRLQPSELTHIATGEFQPNASTHPVGLVEDYNPKIVQGGLYPGEFLSRRHQSAAPSFKLLQFGQRQAGGGREVTLRHSCQYPGCRNQATGNLILNHIDLLRRS
jgi:hypothetical protein